MSSDRRLLLTASAVILVVLVAGFYYLSNLTSDESERVVLSVPGASFNFLWAYAGIDAGIFEREGIDLDIVPTTPPSAAVQAVIAGSAHFTSVAESAATAMLRGADLKIVVYPVVDTPLYLVARPGIDSVQDLGGGTLGVDREFNHQSVVAEQMLLQFDLVLGEDLQAVAVGRQPERLAALRAGSIDATTCNPMDSKVMENEGFNVLASSRDVLERRSILFLATSQQMIDDNPDLVRRMVRATILSVEYIISHPEETIAVAVELMDIDEDLARDTYELHKVGWGYRPNPEDIQQLFDIQNSFLEEPVDFQVSDWMDYSFVNDFLRERGEDPLEFP